MSSAAELEIAEESDVLVVAYFDRLEGDAYTAFRTVAETTDSVAFAETTDKAVGKAAGLSKAGVVIIKNFKARSTLPRSGVACCAAAARRVCART